jgi:hypothetical protein
MESRRAKTVSRIHGFGNATTGEPTLLALASLAAKHERTGIDSQNPPPKAILLE